MGKQDYVKETTQRSEIPFNNVPRHKETKQLLCNENQFAGVHTKQVFFESNFPSNSNLNLNKDKLLSHQTKKQYTKP